MLMLLCKAPATPGAGQVREDGGLRRVTTG